MIFVHSIGQVYCYSLYTATPTTVPNEIFRIKKKIIIIEFGANNVKIVNLAIELTMYTKIWE